MASSQNARVSSSLHPGVQALYFIAVCALTMSAFHPVLVAIAFISGLAYSFYLRGARVTLSSLAWQLPIVLLIAVANPFFSASGSTELMRLGPVAIYQESLAYGACMGLLFVAALIWLMSAFTILTFDKIMALTGNIAPTVALMLSMTARLVPELVRRGKTVSATQRACTAACAQDDAKHHFSRTRLMSVLMGWSMEDSLETSDTMRARGWSRTRKRSVYQRQDFRGRDGWALAVVMALAVLDMVIATRICSSFEFYPTLGTISLDTSYLAYAILFLLPLIVAAWKAWEWR
jgi:energy-coupling factor transport system permease protein